MDNIYSTAKFGEIGIFLSEKMGTNDVSKALILISELKDLIRQEERERARKIIEEEIIYFGRIVGTYLPSSSLTIPLSEHVKKMDGLAERCEEEMKEWKQEALKKLNNEL